MELNPLLGKVKLPGRVFQLPSKGLFYEPTVLAETVKNGEVQVKPMSALAEMKLRSADLLYSGKVLREICSECVPEILKPEQLLTKDVDALFSFLRVVTYGSLLRINSTHSCEKAESHEYEINLDPFLADPKNAILDHKDTIYRVTLSNEQIVNTKPPTYEAAMTIVMLRQEISRMENNNAPIDDMILEKIMITDLLSVIKNVETDTAEGTHVIVADQKQIGQWLRALTKPILNELYDGVKKTDVWGYEFKAKLRCKDCQAEYVHNLELDPINFFFG